MILIDTCLFIDYLRGAESTLADLIEKEDVAVCGIILAELIHGVNSDNEKELIREALNDFEWLVIEDNIWNCVGNNLNQLRRNGVKAPFQDIVLATLCIKNNIQIATKDKHFEMISAVLTDLQIYNHV